MELTHHPSIDKQAVLFASSGGLDFYQKILPGLKPAGSKCRPVKNPFYDDHKASLSLYYKDNQWLFHDFGDTHYSGDVFTFAGFYYKLDPKTDFPAILENMANDLGLSPPIPGTAPSRFPDYPYSKVNINSSIPMNHSSNKKLTLRDHFLDFELKYWAAYGVTLSTLARYGVHPVATFEPFEGVTITSRESSPVFAYKAAETGFKIYQPLNMKYKFQWAGSHPADWYFGYEQLPATGDIVFITGGEKDVLSMNQHGMHAFTLNSETAALPEELYGELAARFGKILILYDLDETGMRQSELLCRQYGLDRCVLPEWVNEKGGKDISDYFRLGGNLESDDILGEHFEKEDFPAALISKNGQSLRFAGIPRITRVRTAWQRLQDAATQPPILQMTGIFFHSGELAILFADTGVGKSVFAVAAGNAIAAGKSFLALNNEAPSQVVVYYDFELSDKQFEKRYSDEQGILFPFHENFFISNLSADQMSDTSANISFDELIAVNIERDIVEKKASVVIIDNLTFLKTQPIQASDTALAVMKKLVQIKRKYSVSILVLAHTPKIYDTNPININHLQGSKHISNFADSVFCLGKSHNDASMRYLKQVKPSRSAEMIYDTDNVILCELLKADNCLTFEFRGYDTELNHLVHKEDVNKELKAQALELKKEGKTVKQIAEILGKSKSAVGRWLKAA